MDAMCHARNILILVFILILIVLVFLFVKKRYPLLQVYVEEDCEYVLMGGGYCFRGLYDPVALSHDFPYINIDEYIRVGDDEPYSNPNLVIRSHIFTVYGNIPVTSIAEGAFYKEAYIDLNFVDDPDSIEHSYGNDLIQSLVIPNTVKEIGNDAFRSCHNLTTVTIPSSVTRIGSGAFKDTPFLENLRKKNPLVVINNILLDANACNNPHVIIPQGVTCIAEDAFYACDNMESVVIPEGVTSIGYEFCNCKNLESVKIPKSVTHIAPVAFSNTPFLYKLQKQNPIVIINGILFNVSSYEGEELIIPKGVTQLPLGLLDDSKIQSLVVPSTVDTIKGSTFASCSLESVTIEKGVKIIENCAFRDCQNLTRVEIKDAKTRIDENAFLGCKNITDVVLPADADPSCYDKVFKNCYYKLKDSMVSGKVDGYEYVDLGLSSGRLWATCNLGATDREDVGDHYAWGETQVKEVYDENNYKWIDKNHEVKKYCVREEMGTVDYKTELDAEDDAAYVHMGKSWRMPSIEDWSELLAGCDWDRISLWHPKKGQLEEFLIGKSKQNGNVIMLPTKDSFGIMGTSYLSSTSSDWQESSENSDYWFIGFHVDSHGGFSKLKDYRYYGGLVRAVVNEGNR